MNLLCKIFFVLILFTSTTVFAQLPTNIGFEDGNFGSWVCSLGQRGMMAGSPDVMYPPSSPVNGRHTILDATYNKDVLDTYGGFPVVCPNGSKYSIKLGNDSPSGVMQRVTYTFTVPAGVSSYSIIFNYAVVLENPTHTTEQQPFFSAKVYDISDNKYVDCPSFDFTASSALPGFKLSDVTRPSSRPGTPPAPVFYKDWSTAMIDLKNYAGKTIRLEFTAEDCKPSGHFGYAYLDIDEQLSLKPITGNVYCSDQTVVTLNGPTGFADYVWYKDYDTTKPGITGQSITVPAVDGNKYALHITPYLGLGCDDILYITLQGLPEPFNLVVAPKVYGCPGTGYNLMAASVTAGSSTMKFSYYKDQFGLEYLPNPDKVLQSGLYYIRGTNLGGCTDILPVEVILISPEISVTQPSSVRYPTKVDLSTTFTHIAGVTYGYFTDAATTIPMVDFSVNVSGTYYVKATSGIGCSVVVPVKVVVNPPPPYTIEAPNTFTPNGDGINDLFSIKTTGYVTLTLLNIFNRYGQLVFTTRSINDYWTGTAGSNTLPNGTYYWIFEGTDDYFHTRVKQASSITIVR